MLQRGDVLELVLSGIYELRERVPIDIDGNAVGPLIGTVPAAGRTLADVQEDVENRLARLSLPISDADNVRQEIRIHPNAVSLKVLEYRPVYVQGDVRAPGSYPFTPGLTVRQAIALAGGFGLGAQLADPQLSLLEATGQIQALKAQRDAARAAVDRLAAEAAGAEGPALASLGQRVALTPQDIGQRHLAVRTDKEKEVQVYLETAVVKTEEELEALKTQYENEKLGAEFDREEVTRLTQAKQAGSITSSRLNDARRALNFSQSNISETLARIAQTERQLASLRSDLRQLSLVGDDVALQELGPQHALLARTNAELHAAMQRAVYLGGLSGELEDDAHISVTVGYADGTVQNIGPRQDMMLRPGAMVEIDIHLSAVADLPATADQEAASPAGPNG